MEQVLDTLLKRTRQNLGCYLLIMNKCQESGSKELAKSKIGKQVDEHVIGAGANTETAGSHF